MYIVLPKLPRKKETFFCGNVEEKEASLKQVFYPDLIQTLNSYITMTLHNNYM